MTKKYPKKNRTNLSDKQLFEYILGSFEYILSYTENFTEKEFENELLIQDAVYHRLQCIGIAAKDLSSNLGQKYADFPWFFYLILDENPPEVIWELINSKSNSDFESIKSLFNELEKLYFKEFYPNKTKLTSIKKTKEPKKKKIIYTTDYKYPIKTSKSIWTVRKK